MKKFNLFALSAALLTAFLANTAFATPASYSPFENATLVSGYNSPTGYQLRSDETGGYGGVDFAVSPGLTFADYNKLSVDYKFTAGSCGTGSPRFVFSVKDPVTADTAYILSYVGDYPNYINCAQGTWVNSTNLLAPTRYFEAPGGAYYDTYADVISTYGNYEVTGIWIVDDSGYAFPGTGQTVVIDNVMINNQTYSFESANSCKGGGFINFTSAPGPFKNQGECVSYFAKGGQ